MPQFRPYHAYPRFPTPNNPFDTKTGVAAWKNALEHAFEANNEAEVWRLFDKFEYYYDPVEFFDRGPIAESLREIIDVWEDRGIGRDIRDYYYGYSWAERNPLRGPAYFFDALRAEPADSKRFRGAARCVMRWLINWWFEDRHGRFEGQNGELFKTVDGLLHLPPAKRRAVWVYMLCGGRGTFGGNLMSRYRSFFKFCFRHLEHLRPTQLIKAVSDLPNKVLEFREKCRGFLPAHPPPAIFGPRSAALAAIEARLKAAVEGTRNHRRIDDEELVLDMFKLAAEARIEAIESGEARAFFRHLIYHMTLAMKDVLVTYTLGLLHTGKNYIVANFVEPMEKAATFDEKLEFAEAARDYIQEAGRFFKPRRGGKDKSPIFAGKQLWAAFTSKTVGGRVIKDEKPPRLYVAGFDSACEEIVEPLWREIALNVRRAIRVLPEKDRIVSVACERERTSKGEWAVYRIINTCDPKAQDDHSTGFGTKILNMWVKSIHDGNKGAEREGEITGERTRLCNLHAFCTTVRLPLWSGPLPENARSFDDD